VSLYTSIKGLGKRGPSHVIGRDSFVLATQFLQLLLDVHWRQGRSGILRVPESSLVAPLQILDTAMQLMPSVSAS
jgi:hypothetical protein